MRWSISGGCGNLSTEAGKYEYAPLFPEIILPIFGRTDLKYTL
jgi:hypothetical protein